MPEIGMWNFMSSNLADACWPVSLLALWEMQSRIKMVAFRESKQVGVYGAGLRVH